MPRFLRALLLVLLLAINGYLVVVVFKKFTVNLKPANCKTDDLLVKLDTDDRLQTVIQANLMNLKRPKFKGGEENRTIVLVVSDYRSGSSLLGEMFNQNDDVYYLFEPLKGVDATKEEEFLEDLMSCNPPKWGVPRRNRQAGPGKDKTAECLKYPIIAAKFIRLRSIERITEYGIWERPNVFIVHSLRDPRGTINSRLEYERVYYNGNAILKSDLTPEIVGEIAESLCERYYNDTVFGDALQEKYLRISYEDLCADPEANVKRAYELIGRDPPQRVFEWFAEHMQAQSTSGAGDPMGLDRNSKLTAVRWKEELPKEYVCAIEENCGELMDYMRLEYACELV